MKIVTIVTIVVETEFTYVAIGTGLEVFREFDCVFDQKKSVWVERAEIKYCEQVVVTRGKG